MSIYRKLLMLIHLSIGEVKMSTLKKQQQNFGKKEKFEEF